MTALARVLGVSAIVIAAAGCGQGAPSGDGGMSGHDSAATPTPCDDDTDCPATYCNMGSRVCCVPATPPYEICGDRIDQNCDGRDHSCGDNDRDGTQACRPGQDPSSESCDCDDERADVRPRVGSIAGAIETCDGIDNDCNGRIDESSACCAACEVLGAARDRADVCTIDGLCDCTTDPADGPCAEGRTCCAAGCVDTRTDLMNCGFCAAACLASADHCENGECRCGSTVPCASVLVCNGGTCSM